MRDDRISYVQLADLYTFRHCTSFAISVSRGSNHMLSLLCFLQADKCQTVSRSGEGPHTYY